MAPRWEKDLYGAMVAGSGDQMGPIGRASPEAAPAASLLEGLLAFQGGDHDRAFELLDWVWRYGGVVEQHPFVRRYLVQATVVIQVAEGVNAALPVSRDAVGLALAELLQERGASDQAIEVVQQLDPSAVAAVSLCELYIGAERYDDAVEVTNGLANEDDATALLLAFRGVAFRELGFPTASREAFKSALAPTARDEGIRHFALFERAKTNLTENKRSMARKDAERILATNPDYPGLREFLATIES